MLVPLIGTKSSEPLYFVLRANAAVISPHFRQYAISVGYLSPSTIVPLDIVKLIPPHPGHSNFFFGDNHQSSPPPLSLLFVLLSLSLIIRASLRFRVFASILSVSGILNSLTAPL